MGQSMTFSDEISVHFDSASQNLLNSELKKSIIYPIWGESKPLLSQTRHAWRLVYLGLCATLHVCHLSSDLLENWHLNVKKLPLKKITKKLLFYSKIAFGEKRQFLAVFLKKKTFGNFLTIKFQFSGGSCSHSVHALIIALYLCCSCDGERV